MEAGQEYINMNHHSLTSRTLARVAGFSYLVIFVAAIFANFFVLESILRAPLQTIQEDHLSVRFGILAFLITVVFDVIVAWALFELFRTHALSGLSTLFRMMHAAIMGTAIFALPATLEMTNPEAILVQVAVFNTIWLIGLFFFGIHLILLGKILGKPKVIAVFLIIAGIMYMTDTAAHFLLVNYEKYGSLLLALVAVPSILGEMSLAVWLLLQGGKKESTQ